MQQPRAKIEVRFVLDPGGPNEEIWKNEFDLEYHEVLDLAVYLENLTTPVNGPMGDA